MKLRNALFAIGFFSGAANALTIPVIPGNQSIRFTFAGWDETTAGYTANCGSTSGSGTADAAGCDTVAGLPARNVLENPAGQEDTWGVLRVTSIEANGVPFYSNPVGNGSHISGFFYHVVDGIVVRGDDTTQTYSYGGILDLYINDGADPLLGIPSPSTRSNATATPTYGDLTSGTLLLRLAFAPGVDSAVPLASLSGSFNNTNIGGGSVSLFDADVLGGAWQSTFNTDAIDGFDDNQHDLELDVGYRCGGGSQGIRCDSSRTDPALDLFTLEIDGSFTGISAADVPEPNIIALMGIGLLGFTVFRSRST